MISTTWPTFRNIFCPSNALWRHIFGSTLAKVISWCLRAPSHYRNQCWLVITDVLWHSPEIDFTWCVHSLNPHYVFGESILTHWGRVTHICVVELTIIGSDNGLSPGRRRAIIWTNTGILSIGPLGTNFSEILIEIYTFSFKKMHLKMSSGKWRPFCLGLNVLKLLPHLPIS